MDLPGNDSAKRSWTARLAQSLMREPSDRMQLVELLRGLQDRGILDADALAMLEGVLQVAEMQVRNIMIPRSQVVMLARDASLEKLLQSITESTHSRFPIIGESRNEVAGILLAKDMLRYVFVKDKTHFNIRDVLRPAVYVPESKRLNVLLKEFRSSRNHMAIVVDEYGGVAGIVTIEDVLEQIVGEIEDEHDTGEDAFIRRHGERHFTVKALTPIEDFNEYFHTSLTDEEFDTLGGLVTHTIGHLPKRGEQAVIGKMRFKVLRADKRRIHMLELILLPDTPVSGDGPDENQA